ncbi:hypothetical protein SDC9_137650 [bioreactor metagenome]|uniref:Uncharacterized protein n=1 Tax=bioreactor metagenome TaxID=1076179 RepID=A0A645DML1_9ZZZZ
MAPHAGQPGQEVFVLSQLHLQAALPGFCAAGEDVQNEVGAVHHLDAQLLGQHPLLGGGKIIVENNQIGAHGLCQLLNLKHLALPDEGAGLGRVLILKHGAHALAPRRLQQGAQLLQGAFAGVFRAGQAVCVQADQYRTVDWLLGKLLNHSSSVSGRARRAALRRGRPL